MTVRRARPGDLDDVRGLLRACDLPADDLMPAHLNHFLVAGDDGALRGVVGLEPCGDAALLRSLAVAPSHRNEDLGARLVDAIEHRARDDGIRTLYLLTTTAADYFRARGYEPMPRENLPATIQETEEAARLCPSSATCMRKTLSTTTRP